jgi:maltooligosyltrehalose trehalohydrolase
MGTPRDHHGHAAIERIGVACQARLHGPQIVDHGVSLNLWAPSAKSVELLETGQPPRGMLCDEAGWYQTYSPTAQPGSRYQFRINGELVVPDPASYFQPNDVSEPSEVINIAALRDSDLRLKISFCEIFGVVQFSTFATLSTRSGHG